MPEYWTGVPLQKPGRAREGLIAPAVHTGSDALQAGDTIHYTIGTFGQSGAPFATRTNDVNSQFMSVHVAET